ncbi:MAG TPA: flagellar hook-associated protein FlgL [Gaiellales bacterium]|jgi:flagellar hook-associated protein 3 FlgL|nr:flagellar hook-associated protein FlgL [Gaiellales bacterium]
MSDRITNAMTARTVMSDIQNVFSELSKTQERLSSGKQLTKPSDDPFGTSRALLYRAGLEANAQYQANTSDASAWLDATDTALGQMGSDAGRARDLILQGANGTLSLNQRGAIASELDQIAESIKTAANTQYAGRYIFSGTATTTAPFSTGGADTYLGNSNVINREIGQNIQVPINVTGDTVATPLLAALRQAAVDLRAGGTPANLSTTDLTALDAASDGILTTRASVGARTNRLTAATDRLQQLEQAQSKQLSDTEDADVAQTMIDFSTQSAVYQAALKAGANLIQPSLLNFLK